MDGLEDMALCPVCPETNWHGCLAEPGGHKDMGMDVPRREQVGAGQGRRGTLPPPWGLADRMVLLRAQPGHRELGAEGKRASTVQSDFFMAPWFFSCF